MSKETQKIISEISAILVRENKITSRERIRMLELLKNEKSKG